MAHKNITVPVSEFKDDEPRYGRWVPILGHNGSTWPRLHSQGSVESIL